jgi:hypothetical protein
VHIIRLQEHEHWSCETWPLIPIATLLAETTQRTALSMTMEIVGGRGVRSVGCTSGV